MVHLFFTAFVTEAPHIQNVLGCYPKDLTMIDAMSSYVYYYAMSCTLCGQSYPGCRSAQFYCLYTVHGPGLVPFSECIESRTMACTLWASPRVSNETGPLILWVLVRGCKKWPLKTKGGPLHSKSFECYIRMILLAILHKLLKYIWKTYFRHSSARSSIVVKVAFLGVQLFPWGLKWWNFRWLKFSLILFFS